MSRATAHLPYPDVVVDPARDLRDDLQKAMDAMLAAPARFEPPIISPGLWRRLVEEYGEERVRGMPLSVFVADQVTRAL